ncbi:MAG: hypothetical protein IKU79_09365, partial [Bacteroidaceae bacterium]|nr:hypothetical protein [Bacteroidaceae bacterium]
FTDDCNYHPQLLSEVCKGGAKALREPTYSLTAITTSSALTPYVHQVNSTRLRGADDRTIFRTKYYFRMCKENSKDLTMTTALCFLFFTQIYSPWRNLRDKNSPRQQNDDII